MSCAGAAERERETDTQLTIVKSGFLQGLMQQELLSYVAEQNIGHVAKKNHVKVAN